MSENRKSAHFTGKSLPTNVTYTMRFSKASERGWKIKEVFTIFIFWLVKNWYFIHEEILEHAQNILSTAAHIVLCRVYVDKFRIRLCMIQIWERNLSKVQKFHSKNKHSLSNIYRMWGFSLRFCFSFFAPLVSARECVGLSIQTTF